MGAWRTLLFHDEDQAAKATRDPIAPAPRSPTATPKAQTKQTPDGRPVHSFRTLLKHLSTVARNVCRPCDTHTEQTFILDTHPDGIQQQAYDLLKTLRV